MENRPKLYATVAFVAGVLVCLGFKDIYPDLERRYRRRYGVRKTLAGEGLSNDDQIHLEDHEAHNDKDEKALDVPIGIEACIGSTPLFKIKSLSEATGCEILGKAEVCQFVIKSEKKGVLKVSALVPKWRWWESKRSSRSQNNQYGKIYQFPLFPCAEPSSRQKRRGS